MNNYIITIFVFVVVWTVFAGLFLWMFARMVRWLERQSLYGGQGFKDPFIFTQGSKTSTKVKMNEDALARINEELDTRQAHKAASRQEDIRVVGEANCSERNMEGDDIDVINNLKKFKKT